MISEGTIAVAQETISFFDAAPRQAAAESANVVILPSSGCPKSPHRALAQDLADAGHRALSLDFSGCGDSSGTFEELTLDRRRDQAAAVIEARLPAQAPVILVGFSMSGQTVADLIEPLGERITGVVLGAPAVYPGVLRDVPFGDPGFMRLRSAPETWPDNPGLKALSEFWGQALLLLPENDEQVPAAMTELVEQSMSANPRFAKRTVAGADHLLDEWLDQHPEERRTLVRELTALAR